MKAVYFSYSQNLRYVSQDSERLIFNLESSTNIEFKKLIAGSDNFDPILAETTPNYTLSKSDQTEFVKLTEKELNTFNYLSNRIAVWGKFYDNKSISGDSFYEKQNKGKYYLQLFYNYFKSNKPDFVLLDIIPHLGLDYIFYLAAKKADVPVLILHRPINPNAFLIFESIEDIGDIQNLPECPFSVDEFPLANEKQEWWYMLKQDRKKIKAPKIKLGPSLSFKINKIVRRNYKKWGLKNRSNQNLKAIKRATKEFDQARLSSVKDKLDQKYVLFALHLNYELTTAPLGDDYMDQIDALERLRKLVPNDVMIVVKENPKQGYHQRDKWFFERMNRMKNVHYIRGGYDMKALIANSQFVATLLGTSSYEAVCRGIPALNFGYAWYAGTPGVFKYNSDLDYDTIVNYKVNLDDVNAHRKLLSSRLIPGITAIPNFMLKQMTIQDRQEAYRQVAKGLIWYLKEQHSLDAKLLD